MTGKVEARIRTNNSTVVMLEANADIVVIKLEYGSKI